MDIQTALQADIIIKGSKLRELLDSLTTAEFTEFLRHHCGVLIPNTGLTEEDLYSAIKDTGISDPKHIEPIAHSYIKDAVNCSFDYDQHAFRADFLQHLNEYVADWENESIEDVIARLTRAQCEELLASISIQIFEDEVDEELREAVLVNYQDGTLDKTDIRDLA